MDREKIKQFLESRKWFTDCGLSKYDINELVEDWEGNWEELKDLWESYGFEVFPAKKEDEELWSTIYVNFDKFPDPDPQVEVTQAGAKILKALSLEDEQMEELKASLRNIARILASSEIRLGSAYGKPRIDFSGDPHIFKENVVVRQLEEELNLVINVGG